jgi:hypothetical protein
MWLSNYLPGEKQDMAGHSEPSVEEMELPEAQAGGQPARSL